MDFTVKDGGSINVSAPTPSRPVNHPPKALDQHVTTGGNKQVQVALGATDNDPGDSLTAHSNTTTTRPWFIRTNRPEYWQSHLYSCSWFQWQ